MNIKPAILPHTFEEITEKLSRVEGLARTVQIDLCDGVFGREKTWLPEGNETLPAGFSYEFDIMVSDWKVPLMRSIMIGASSVVAHVDMFTDENLEEYVSIASSRGVLLGIAVSNDKSVEFHADMVRKARALYPKIFIQVMGILKIGEQGQFFEPEAATRVVALQQQFSDIPIQVDGGMSPDTAALVVKSGAETVVVGSFIFGSEDAGGAIEKLELAISQ